jgi:hypothetical protein
VKHGGAAPESCHIHLSDDWGAQGSEARCVVHYRLAGSPAMRRSVVTARLLPFPQAARDFAAARALSEGPFRSSAGMQIPRPLALLEPLPLVLFDFGPTHNLRAHLKTLGDRADLRAAIATIARGLRLLHDSGVAAVEENQADSIAHRLSARQPVVARLLELGPSIAERADLSFRRLADRAASIQRVEPTFVHGALDWNAIVHEEGRLYFYRFETCRRSHPGLDVGSLLADLRCFYLLRKKSDPRLYPLVRDVSLRNYFGGAPCSWQDDLPFFTALALHERLRRLLQCPRGNSATDVEALLEQCGETVNEGAPRCGGWAGPHD